VFASVLPCFICVRVICGFWREFCCVFMCLRDLRVFACALLCFRVLVCDSGVYTCV